MIDINNISIPAPTSLPAATNQSVAIQQPTKQIKHKHISHKPRIAKPHNQKQNNKQSIGLRFITAFTKEIIRAVKARQRKFSRISHPVMDIQIPEISTKDTSKNVTVMLQSKPTEHKIVSETPRVILNAPRIPLRKSFPTRPIDWTHQGLPAPQPQITNQQQFNSSIQQLSLDKIKNILLRQEVFSVECPGPGKPLVIVSRGISNIANVTLTDEEISILMKDISQKTRIPLVTGLFKAVLGNLLITAVISDFVGTRFIIQKRA